MKTIAIYILIPAATIILWTMSYAMPLHNAAESGDVAEVKRLVEKGADAGYAITKLEGLRGDKGYDQSEVEAAIVLLKKLAAETVRK